ncbi:MAG: thioredoxin family protein [Phycisphaerales bacterium]|nr:thioredoxin family protein [Phycisphaerales bacterium]
MLRWRLLPLLLVLLAAFQPAAAQPPGTEPRVKATVEWSHNAYLPGSQGAMAVILQIEPGWHIYPGIGSPDAPELYIPTSIELALPDGWTRGEIQWPAAHEVTFGPEGAQEQVKVYEGRAVAYIPFLVPTDAAGGPASGSVTVAYQACDDITCEPPTDTRAALSTTVVSDATAVEASDDPALAETFAQLLAKPVVAASEPVQAEPAPAAGAADPSTQTPAALPNTHTFFGIEIPRQDGLVGLLLLIGISALGGFLLNLTPCVLPVIPIKIMTIMQHANHPGRGLVLGLWMALGVVAFWAAIGVPVALVSVTGISDPSRLFGIWWLTLGIGAVIALMGVGIMGLFTIQLPQAVYAVNPRADSAWGSFVFGIMTAVLGLPCFGFVAGALLAGVAAMPPLKIMVIFISLGVGMGGPYIVLSANPKWLDRLPRTGPASELVKQVMGLLLLAAAAFFIGAGLIALVREKPYLSHQLHWWAVALFAALAGLWLIVRTYQITARLKPRIVFSIVGLFLGAIAVLYAAGQTARSRADWLVHQEALAKAGGGAVYIHGAWNEYTPAAFEKARADGHIVVADFTAEWCLNCKIIKAAVLNKEPVLSTLNSDDVVKFVVDLTSNSAPGWTYIKELGQTGIPLLAIYTPGSDDPWLSNAYTSQQVLDAIAAARSSRDQAARSPVMREYSAEAFEEALDSGAVVFLVFYAEWDLTNVLLHRQIVESEAVRSELLKPGTIGFEVDVTSNQAPGWDLLKQLDSPGPPSVAIYGPERDSPRIDTLGPLALAEAIAAARSSDGTAKADP